MTRTRRPVSLACATLAACIGVAGLSAGAGPDETSAVETQAAPRARTGDLGPGVLLVSARGLPDPNFAESVVLLIDYSADGAMGLVVNVRTDVPLARLFKQLEIGAGDAAVAFLGGPVSTSGIMALVRAEGEVAGARVVIDGVHLVEANTLMADRLRTDTDSSRFRVYMGYSGWGPGQLPREVELGTWHVLGATADVVFDANLETLWQRQIMRTDWRRASVSTSGASAGP